MSNLVVSASPHIREGSSTRTIMRDVIIALTPAFVYSIMIFGFRAALVTAVCVGACVLSEWIFTKTLKKPTTITDLSAVLTGVILAFNLPVTIPLWQAVFGSAAAIILVKQLFGGLGKNFANPAATARIIMTLAFATTMTTWVLPIDGVTGATPLAIMAHGDTDQLPSLMNMFFGIHGGSLGETSSIGLLIGGLYLMVRRVITWHTPVVFISTVFVFSWLLGFDPVYQILSGGLFIGAIFMATDYVTTPQTSMGKIIFAFGAGSLTVLIRFFGNYPEGVSFSILLMNILTPFINRLTISKPLGSRE